MHTPQPAPEWALLQRELLHRLSSASERYFERYFDEQGYLLSDLRWAGNDGPDEAIENVNWWPELHALGGSDRVMELYQKAYEGHVRQYTYLNEVQGTHIPYIADGMYYKEFPTKMDWVHNSEGITVFNGMGLGDPYDPVFEHRVCRFAGFYMGSYPGWEGNLFSGALVFRLVMRSVIEEDRVVHEEPLLEDIGRVRSVRLGPDGLLYVMVEDKGFIVRLIPVE